MAQMRQAGFSPLSRIHAPLTEWQAVQINGNKLFQSPVEDSCPTDSYSHLSGSTLSAGVSVPCRGFMPH